MDKSVIQTGNKRDLLTKESKSIIENENEKKQLRVIEKHRLIGTYNNRLADYLLN